MRLNNQIRFNELANLIGKSSLAILMGISRCYLHKMLLDENKHLIDSNKDRINTAVQSLIAELDSLKIK